MFESQDLRASEWLPMGLGIVAFLLLGAALLMLLAAFRFPRFRSFAMWCIAVAIRPDRFEQGTVAHEIACGLKRWFSGAVALPGDAFEYMVPAGHLTIGQVEDEPWETHEALVADKKAATVLRHLHRRAAGTPYGQYLPSIDDPSQTRPSAAFGPAACSAMRPWYSAMQIRQQHVDGLAGQHVAWMFNRMLEILGYAHRQGIVHAAVLPQNLWFNTETHGLRLVDWTHAKKIGRSLSAVPQIMQRSLCSLMALCLRRGFVRDPAILVGGIGDAKCDLAPLQVGQFESGNEFELDLDKLFLEGGGGGQQRESYELALYFLARKTAMDGYDKRGKKGYAFIIGDEMPYRRVCRREVKRVFGDQLPEDIPLEQILQEAQRKYEVYFILPNLTSYYHDERIIDCWRKLLGQYAIRLPDPSGISELIASAIGLAEESIGWDELSDNLQGEGASQDVVQAVESALQR